MAQIDLDTLPRTRKEALAANLKHYFNGKPCPKGHLGARFASSGGCFECVYQSTARQSKRKLAAQKEKVLSMRVSCKQCGEDFTPEFGRGKKSQAACYCSDECRIAADRASKARWIAENPERRKEVANSYVSRMTEQKGEVWAKARKRTALYQKARRTTDPAFKLGTNLRSRLRMALKNRDAIKETSVIRLVGCSLEALAAHLESQFEPGMTWDNWTRDGWHIDHVLPIASFDRPDHPDCWHYTNLRPLWAEENLKKGARLVA